MNYSLITIKNFSCGIMTFLKEVCENPDRCIDTKDWDKQIEESESNEPGGESTEKSDMIAEINDIASKLQIDGHQVDSALHNFASRSIEELLKSHVTVESEKHIIINRVKKRKI